METSSAAFFRMCRGQIYFACTCVCQDLGFGEHTQCARCKMRITGVFGDARAQRELLRGRRGCSCGESLWKMGFVCGRAHGRCITTSLLPGMTSCILV